MADVLADEFLHLNTAVMDVKIVEVPSKNGQRIYYTLEWGKGPGERVATGKYTWLKPKNQVQKDYNKEVLDIIKKDQAQKLIDIGSIGTTHVPSHRIKPNFLDFYADYVRDNFSATNRSLSCSFEQFKKFVKKSFLSPNEITENFCERFRKHLLDRLGGETPADYFMRFKRVVKAAYKQGYFRLNVAEDVKAKSHPTSQRDVIPREDYPRLFKAFCPNYEVKKAAVCSMYQGFRWCDVSTLRWRQIKSATIVLKKQAKTGVPLEVPLHPVVKMIMGERRRPDDLVFQLPTATQSNSILKAWVASVNPDIYITWHCLRHSVSDLMQSAGVHVMTVAAVLGQTTVKYLLERYQKRVRIRDTQHAMDSMPDLSEMMQIGVDNILTGLNDIEHSQV